jgi:hypothetical protein
MRRIAAAIVAVACFAALSSATASAEQSESNPNPELYRQDARPFGTDIATWAERATQWIWGTPLDRSPLFDPTGANCAVNQEGPVWYIARIAGPPVFSGTRTCTIPRHKAVFLYIGAVVDSYPCPDPNWHPAPGQSLYEFMLADAKAGMNLVDHLEVSLDGRQLSNVFSYRYHSDNLFELTGDPSLREVLDPCITGWGQPAVLDGFFMVFKPLKKGRHVLRVHGTATPIGHDKTFTYFLTVE